MKQQYQHKRAHWRGWPKVLGWMFLTVSVALSIIAIAEAQALGPQPFHESNVRIIIESLLAVVGFLVKLILDRMERTQRRLFEQRRLDHERIGALEKKLEDHLVQCKTTVGMEEMLRQLENHIVRCNAITGMENRIRKLQQP